MECSLLWRGAVTLGRQCSAKAALGQSRAISNTKCSGTNTGDCSLKKKKKALKFYLAISNA